MSNRACVTLLFFVALLLAFACAPPPAPRRVVVLGIDGATWRAIDPLIARDELPSFAALKRAAWGGLASLPPYSSPQIWTSIATGQPPAIHGIDSFTAKATDGSSIPASSNLRKAPALWNIVGLHGRTVGVVGWYASWPAEKVNGFVVSDHVRPADESAFFWPVTAEQEARLIRRTYPEELLSTIQPMLMRPGDVERARMKEDLQVFGLKHPYLKDETYMRVALDLYGRSRPDVLLLSQYGTDVMQHLGFGPFEDFLAGDDRDEKLACRIIDYYRYEDENLSRVISAMGGRLDGAKGQEQIRLPAGSLLIVVSDHGFEPRTRPKQPIILGDHAPEGILALAGRDVAPGRINGASVLDILPTVLHAMAIPISRELPGKVLTAAFHGELARAAPRAAEGYAFQPEGGNALPSPLDEKILDELRALGYIK